MFDRFKEEGAEIKNPAVDLDKLNLNNIKKLSPDEQDQIQMDLAHYIGAAHQLAVVKRTKFESIITQAYQQLSDYCEEKNIVLEEPVNYYAKKIINMALQGYQQFATQCKDHAGVFIDPSKGFVAMIVRNQREILYDGREKKIYSKGNRPPFPKFDFYHVREAELKKTRTQKTEAEDNKTKEKRPKRKTPSLDLNNDHFLPPKKKKVEPAFSEEPSDGYQNNEGADLWTVVNQAIQQANVSQNYHQLIALHQFLQSVLFPQNNVSHPNPDSFYQHVVVANHDQPLSNGMGWDPNYMGNQICGGQYQQQFQAQGQPQQFQQQQQFQLWQPQKMQLRQFQPLQLQQPQQIQLPQPQLVKLQQPSNQEELGNLPGSIGNGFTTFGRFPFQVSNQQDDQEREFAPSTVYQMQQ